MNFAKDHHLESGAKNWNNEMKTTISNNIIFCTNKVGLNQKQALTNQEGNDTDHLRLHLATINRNWTV